MRAIEAFVLAAAAAFLALAGGAAAQPQDMTFFLTSAGPGNGADLGGLAGADAHCQALAEAAGAGGRTWAAYLSTQGADGAAAVHARDRIGTGPWRNAEGVEIAASLDQLHGDNNLTKETALAETGSAVNGRGDDPNRHDILTGSMPDGRAVAGADDATCANWTSSAAEGSAIVGHHDRMGLQDTAEARSWNSSHPSRGCSQEALRGTGGDGLFYCFATD